MSGTATAVLVGGVGLAAFLYFRSQQTQAAALGVTGVAPVTSLPGPVTGGGGGVQGLGSRLWTQWKGDPLGIQNTKAALGTAGSVVKTGAKDVGHLATSIVGGIRSIF